MSNSRAIIGPWRKSRYSNSQGNCVEVAPTTSGVAVRDSKEVNEIGEGRASVLAFSPDEWTDFLKGVVAGDFEF